MHLRLCNPNKILADAVVDLKSPDRKIVPVQAWPRATTFFETYSNQVHIIFTQSFQNSTYKHQ
jgi:hypothetical protein